MAVKIRLSFAETSDPNVEFWKNRLESRGVRVTSARLSGIDAEGEIPSIEDALGTKFDLSDLEKPVVGKISITEKPGKAPPIAYIPRKPTYF